MKDVRDICISFCYGERVFDRCGNLFRIAHGYVHYIIALTPSALRLCDVRKTLDSRGNKTLIICTCSAR